MISQKKTISFRWHLGDDFCWVDSVEIAFPKKLFRLVGPWGFVGIDSVENAFPKAISFKCISLVFAFGLLAIVYN